MIDWLPTLIISAVLIGIVVIAQRSNKRKKKDTTDGSDVDDIPRLVELSRENEALKTELSDANRQIASLRRRAGSTPVAQLRQDNDRLERELSDAKRQINTLRRVATQREDSELGQLRQENEALTTKLSDANRRIASLHRGAGSADSSQLRQIRFPPVTKERLAELRAMNYPEYLQTPEWTQRTAIMKAWFGDRCQACYRHSNERQLEVHHRTYKRLGNEHPIDLTVLCRECHQLIHDHYPELGR